MSRYLKLAFRAAIWIAPALAVAVPQAALPTSPPAGSGEEHRAVSSKPFDDWTSGFLSGNGNIGVIMRGQPYDETLVVNGKLYLPRGSKEILPDLSGERDAIRQAGLAAGAAGPAVAHKMITRNAGEIVQIDPFHPAFFLRIAIPGAQTPVRNFRMTEDFTTGEIEARWTGNQGEWSRKLFVSRPDNVAVLLLTGPPGKLTFDLWIEIEHPQIKPDISVEKGWIAAHNVYTEGKGGYDALIRLVPSGGRMVPHKGRLVIEGADRVLAIIQLKPWKAPLLRDRSEAWAYSPDNPEFQRDHSTNRLPEMKAALSRLTPDYARLLAPHARAHASLYRRVALDLRGGAGRQIASEQLLAQAATEGKLPPALAERIYNACRYLMLSSTGDTPPNLQGIWSGTWNPDWSAGYTLDSNLQLEVQSLMSTNMPELMLSYFNLVDSWIPDWKRNARKLFGFRGVVSTLHASNVGLLFPRPGFPREQAAIGIAGWLLHFYYDYYRFTGDRRFLAARFVPLAKEIALFYEDFLTGTEDASGKYRFYMGYSPEHGLVANTTYDISIAKNVLTTLVEACTELGIEQQNIPKWQTMLSRMPPYLVNARGELQEWSWPGIAEDPDHRHHSQFLPLYQFCEFDRDRTPDLWKAAGLAFEQKLRNWLHREKGSNSNHITHGMMNQGQIAARLGRGDIVYEVISRMATRKYIYPSFMIGYWPGPRGFGFDAPGAIPDVVNNSLIFRWGDTIDLLPALPTEWPQGSLRGVLLRGQVRVEELSWDIPARRINIALHSAINQTLRLRFPPGMAVRFDNADSSGRIALSKNRTARLSVSISSKEN